MLSTTIISCKAAIVRLFRHGGSDRFEALGMRVVGTSRGVLDAGSYDASKPGINFREGIVGFGENLPIVFIVKIGGAVHIFYYFHNSPKTLIRID